MPDSFEVAFSDLAYSFLQEKALKLVEHLVGFEVVTKNDKGSKGLGIFAFKVGNEYLYAPVFFLNGEIKPLELLYLKDEDLFVPLDEDWANYLLKKNPLQLGEPSDEKRKLFDSPSLDMFAHPPITGKHVTAHLKDLSSPTRHALDYLEDATNYVKEAFLRELTNNKPFLQEAVSAYGFDDLKNALQFHEYEKQSAETVQEVEVVTSDMPEAIRKLSPAKKKKVYTDKVVVKDNRPQEWTAKLYNTQYTDKLQNPQESGVYQLLDGHGNLVEALVLLTPQGRELYGSPKATVVEVESGRFICAPVSKIWVKDNLVIDDYTGLFKKMKVRGRSKGKPGDYCLFLNRNRRGQISSSPPFCIKKVVKDSNGVLNYQVQFVEGEQVYENDVKKRGSEYGDHHSGGNPAGQLSEYNTYTRRFEHMKAQTDAELQNMCHRMNVCLSPMMDINDGDLYVLSDELIVPGNFSLLPLQQPKMEEGSKFRLGSPGAVMHHLVANNMNRLRVRSDGSEYFVTYNDKQEKPLDKTAAVRLLVNKYQLSGDDALGLLKDAETPPRKPIDVIIKFAAIGGVTGLEIPDPVITSDEYGFVPKGQQLFNEELIVNKGTYPEIPELGKDENLYQSPDAAPPALDMSAAMTAAQGGQQSVFDHATLASLVRISDTAEAINKYLPDLEKALDRIGRLLFMFWWNHEDFMELFGITQMNELEDLLRNVFKSFGELILELKKKERARLPMQ